MRLPSHQYDPKDLLRNMSVALDGPEEVIEGDDYLQPTSSITELPEENTTPISNGKVRTLFHSLPATYPRRTPHRSATERYVHCSIHYLQPTRGEHHADQQRKGTYTVPFTSCNLPEEDTAPISNGKVRTLFHSLPEENAAPITRGKVRTLFHLADKLHHRTTQVEHYVNQ